MEEAIARFGLEDQMRLVELEPILSQEQLTLYYTAEDRVEFREIVQWLAREFTCRIEMRQVGARDEARIVADYERCGQHCCCKNFLKVLKPVSMRSAKVQKATLDPLKISGRCGRLMCCLRYEDQTYSELKSRLPHKKTRVGTPEGPAIVIDSKILVQLVLVKLEKDNRQIAVPVEELCDPDNCPEPGANVSADPLRGIPSEELDPSEKGKARKKRKRRRKGQRGDKDGQQDAYRAAAQAEEQSPGQAAGSGALAPEVGDPTDAPKKKRRRRRRRRSGGDASDGNNAPKPSSSQQSSDSGESAPKKKRRRRRRRRGGGNDKNPPSPSSEG